MRHQIWVVDDVAVLARLTESFDAMQALYVADGHHRSAAASRVCAERKAANPAHTGEESYNYFLAVIFPHNQMQILDYNRVVGDLNGLEPQAFLARVAEAFSVEPSRQPVRPAAPAQFGMYLGGQWYRLQLKPERIPADDPVGRLDVSLLADNLIASRSWVSRIRAATAASISSEVSAACRVCRAASTAVRCRWPFHSIPPVWRI